MIEDFEIQIATKFVFGRDAENSIGAELRGMRVGRVLLHYGGGSYLSGPLARVRGILHESGIDVVELGGVRPNPRLTLVRTGIDICNENGVQAIVAVGGGSVIDSAKAIALGAASDTDVWDYFRGKVTPTRTLPVAAVLTCPAAGSESSQVVVVNDEENHEKLLVSDPVVRPALAFMNPELSVTVPKSQTACGVVDMFSHVCERYFTDSTEFGVLDAMSEGVLRTLVSMGGRLMTDPGDYEARAEVMWIATIAQNNSLGMGRNQDWSTHTISNGLSALYDVPHGRTISAIMPSWMTYVYKNNPKRFARYAREVFDVAQNVNDDLRASEEGIAATAKFFGSLGMPCSMNQLDLEGIAIEDVLESIEFYGDDESIGSVRRLDRAACRDILVSSAEGRYIGNGHAGGEAR